jgi:hypothetical protein
MQNSAKTTAAAHSNAGSNTRKRKRSVDAEDDQVQPEGVPVVLSKDVRVRGDNGKWSLPPPFKKNKKCVFNCGKTLEESSCRISTWSCIVLSGYLEMSFDHVFR